MTNKENMNIGLVCAALGLLGMVFLGHVVHGMTYTMLAGAVILALMTSALAIHHAGYQIVVASRQRTIKVRADRAPKSLRH